MQEMMYLFLRWLADIVMRSFFREIKVVNGERIPLYGPVIFVGNHNNQFIDACLLVVLIPRKIRFLMAEKSLKRKVIGTLARASGCIAVRRPEDLAFPGIGKIYWKEGENEILGTKTEFILDFKVGYTIQFMGECFVIETINNKSSIIVNHNINFSLPANSKNVAFVVLPKVVQTAVYSEVSKSLKMGDTVGMFPEGGSHDQTQLLPLKPGVAIMGYSAILQGAEDVLVVPVGMTYEQPESFLSKALVFFGKPIILTQTEAAQFSDDKKNVTKKALVAIESAMKSVIVTSQNHEMMELLKLCTSLFPPERMKLVEDKFYTLKKLISIIFWDYEKEPTFMTMLEELRTYKNHLKIYCINDHEVWILKLSTTGATVTLFTKIFYIIPSFAVGLVFFPLWFPLMIASNFLAENHRKKSLESSSVKHTASDVVASYKVIVLLVLVPLTNFIYGLLAGIYFYGTVSMTIVTILLALCILPLCYWISIRFAETTYCLLNHIRFLIIVLIGKINIWRDRESALIAHRNQMQILVRDVLGNLAYQKSPDFASKFFNLVPQEILKADSKRLISKPTYYIPTATANYCVQEEIL